MSVGEYLDRVDEHMEAFEDAGWEDDRNVVRLLAAQTYSTAALAESQRQLARAMRAANVLAERQVEDDEVRTEAIEAARLSTDRATKAAIVANRLAAARLTFDRMVWEAEHGVSMLLPVPSAVDEDEDELDLDEAG